jgi:hypothetical protein
MSEFDVIGTLILFINLYTIIFLFIILFLDQSHGSCAFQGDVKTRALNGAAANIILNPFLADTLYLDLEI